MHYVEGRESILRNSSSNLQDTIFFGGNKKDFLVCCSPSLQVVFCWLHQCFSEPYQHLFVQVDSSHMRSVSVRQPLLPSTQNRDIHNNKVSKILCYIFMFEKIFFFGKKMNTYLARMDI